MSKDKSNNYLVGGITFMQLLFLVFLILKLTETTVVATWSWWWVTAPLWMGVAILIGVWAVFCLIMLFSIIIKIIFK